MFTSPNDDMKIFADNLWEYFKPMLTERLEHNIGWFRAVVTANPGNGMLTIQRPFDTPFTVKCTSSMSGASVGDNVLVFSFGENLGTNAIVVGTADGTNIGDGGEVPLPVAKGGTGAITGTEALQNLGSSEPVWECKNVLRNTAQSATANGITFTVNADGTVLIDGTASANTDLYFVGASGVYADAGISNGDYVASLEMASGTISDTSGARLYFVRSGGTIIGHASSGSPLDITFTNTTYRIFIRIMSGTVCTNVVVQPMVRLASVTDDTYVPYAMTNYQLTSKLFDLVYPVGSIYMSVNSTSPATLFGGTWERIQDTFLLAAGSTYTAGDVGGEAEHALTISEMPSHDHGVSGWYTILASSTSGQTLSLDGPGYWQVKHPTAQGSGTAHNNMPPYLAVYVWQRTA